MLADEIPVAHTPTGGYGDDMPPPVLAGCTEPLRDGAPDMRGLWRLVSIDWKVDPPPGNALDHHVERIEQCGDRVCITSTGIIHDMRADGSVERGVHDVTPEGAPIEVVCTFEEGVHTLRPVGLPGFEVTRHLDGEQLVWSYGPLFTARLENLNSRSERKRGPFESDRSERSEVDQGGGRGRRTWRVGSEDV